METIQPCVSFMKDSSGKHEFEVCLLFFGAFIPYEQTNAFWYNMQYIAKKPKNTNVGLQT